MKQTLSLLALAASGALIAANAGTAQANSLSQGFLEAAVVGPAPAISGTDTPRDVIEPPSSIDPGMALDPPQTGAKMPVVRPPGTIDRPVQPH